MQTHACSLLLAACCLHVAGTQSAAERTDVWRDPIRFKTKTADSCTMAVTGYGDVTRLRVTCVGAQRPHRYWCEYEGKPHMCRNYNLNPHHYFTQMMWGLRKMQNACRGPREVKPQMCRRATDEAQMTFSASSSSAQPTSTGRLTAADDGMRRGAYRPLRKPPPAREPPQTPKPSPSVSTPPLVESRARALAREYCWRSFHGLCAYVIGWFPH